jgi:hypothetical protein
VHTGCRHVLRLLLQLNAACGAIKLKIEQPANAAL